MTKSLEECTQAGIGTNRVCDKMNGNRRGAAPTDGAKSFHEHRGQQVAHFFSSSLEVLPPENRARHIPFFASFVNVIAADSYPPQRHGACIQWRFQVIVPKRVEQLQFIIILHRHEAQPLSFALVGKLRGRRDTPEEGCPWLYTFRQWSLMRPGES